MGNKKGAQPIWSGAGHKFLILSCRSWLFELLPLLKGSPKGTDNGFCQQLAVVPLDEHPVSQDNPTDSGFLSSGIDRLLPLPVDWSMAEHQHCFEELQDLFPERLEQHLFPSSSCET